MIRQLLKQKSLAALFFFSQWICWACFVNSFEQSMWCHVIILSSSTWFFISIELMQALTEPMVWKFVFPTMLDSHCPQSKTRRSGAACRIACDWWVLSQADIIQMGTGLGLHLKQIPRSIYGRSISTLDSDEVRFLYQSLDHFLQHAMQVVPWTWILLLWWMWRDK